MCVPAPGNGPPPPPSSAPAAARLPSAQQRSARAPGRGPGHERRRAAPAPASCDAASSTARHPETGHGWSPRSAGANQPALRDPIGEPRVHLGLDPAHGTGPEGHGGGKRAAGNAEIDRAARQTRAGLDGWKSQHRVRHRHPAACANELPRP